MSKELVETNIKGYGTVKHYMDYEALGLIQSRDASVNGTGWEYKILVLKHKSTNIQLEVTLNEIGKRGWELVSIYEGIAYFKRKIGYQHER